MVETICFASEYLRFPIVSHGFPLGFPWVAYGFPIVFPLRSRFLHQNSVAQPSRTCRIPGHPLPSSHVVIIDGPGV